MLLTINGHSVETARTILRHSEILQMAQIKAGTVIITRTNGAGMHSEILSAGYAIKLANKTDILVIYKPTQ